MVKKVLREEIIARGQRRVQTKGWLWFPALISDRRDANDRRGCGGKTASRCKKKPPLPAAKKLITGRRQTEWTGATRCPKKDNPVMNEKA
jgi:hypothetical protein